MLKKIFEEKQHLEAESEEKDSRVSELTDEVNALKAEIEKLKAMAVQRQPEIQPKRNAQPSQPPQQRTMPSDGGRTERKFMKNGGNKMANPPQNSQRQPMPQGNGMNRQQAPMPPHSTPQRGSQPSWDRDTDEVIPYKGPQRQLSHNRQADVEIQVGNPVKKQQEKPKKRGFFGFRR